METASQRADASSVQALPTGTVTFLFTDIEGSTERWESHREAMKAAVARHDGLMRAAIEAHGGYVFKTVGDAFCAAFRTAPEAIRAAVEAQRALLKEDFSSVDGLHVRAALHSGYAHERDGDYFGPTVNRVARLLAIGHGGQILVSAATTDLAQGELPPQTSLRDLGAHRLKDLAHPEHVFALIAPDLVSEFAPLKSLDALPNNLPLQVTSFIGRESEVDEVKSLVDKGRLLTLSGPGGVGKTRLALQAGAELLDRYPDGVWLVEFATLTDPDLVPSEVALILNVRVAADHSLTDSIVFTLNRKRMLLILDNCEHLVSAVARLARAIVQSCPTVNLIATSREGLGIAGKQIVRVTSLTIPAKSEALTAKNAVQFGAIALFADRAGLASKSFHLTDENVAVVADICRRLDGIPFAIELAAARVKVLSVADLSRALHERFRVLTGGDRTALPRQKTMRALIDWSYDLLSEKEKAMLRRLAVFAGGCTAEEASMVCQGGEIDALDVLDMVSLLVDKSLIVAETSGETARYRLLDSTREYALEKLSESGERETVERQHAEFYRKLAQEAGELYFRAAPPTWLADVQLELDNFRAAMDWGLAERRDPILAGSIAGALGDFWFEAGLVGVGLRSVNAALEALDEDIRSRPDDRRVQAVAASLYLAAANLSSGERTCEVGQRALELYTKLGARRGAAWSRYSLGFGHYEAGRANDARQLVGQARSEFQALGLDRWTVRCLNLEAVLHWIDGHLDGARVMYSKALETSKRIADARGIALVVGNLAELEFGAGNVERAIELGTEANELNRRIGRVSIVANGHCNLAAYRIRRGDLEAGRESAREALRIAREVQLSHIIAYGSQHLALIEAERGDPSRAALLLGYVEGYLRTAGQVRQTTEAWGYAAIMTALRAKLSEAEISTLIAEGSAWQEEKAIEEAFKI